MDTSRIIYELKAERDRIERAIAAIEGLNSTGRRRVDVDALLRQPPGQLRECAGLVCQFKLLQRALGVRRVPPGPEPSWLC